MKFIKFNLKILALALLASASVSCENAQTDIYVPANVYFPRSGNVEIQPLLGESTLDLGIYKSGINQKGAAQLTVNVDKDLVNDFITSNPGYTLLPDQHYSLPSTTIVIPEDDQQVFLKVNFHAIHDGFTDTKYVLPIQIKSVNENASLLESKKTTYLMIKRFRNAFEGSYKIEGLKTSEGQAAVKLQAVVNAVTSGAQTIRIQGAESSMFLDVTIQNNDVRIQAAPGSENYLIQPSSGKTSTWSGSFSNEYQRNTGTLTLYYTYQLNGKTYHVETEVKSWL